MVEKLQLVFLCYDPHNMTYGSLVQHFLLPLSGALCKMHYHTGQVNLHPSLTNTAFQSAIAHRCSGFGKLLLNVCESRRLFLYRQHIVFFSAWFWLCPWKFKYFVLLWERPTMFKRLTQFFGLQEENACFMVMNFTAHRNAFWTT